VDITDPVGRDKLLKVYEVGDVWGIGRRMSEHLNNIKIKTAWD
jgi:DNA polymerase V